MTSQSKIRNTEFNLPSNRKLWKTLGGYDAVVEFIECSKRAFLMTFNEKSETFQEFLIREAKSVDVYLRDVSMENYKCVIHKSYLVFPFACFDEFIDDYICDIKQIIDGKFSLEQEDGKTKFHRLLDALRKRDITPNISTEKRNLLDYYRLVRNNVAHGGSLQTTTAFNKIDRLKIHETYPTLSEPHMESALEFDDFILCTANIKNIADILSVSLCPKIQWEQIAVKYRKLFPEIKQSYTAERKRTYIRNCVREKYGIILKDDVCDSIIDSLE